MCITLGLLCLGWIHNETIPIEAKSVSELWAWRTWKLNSPHVKLSRPGAFLKFPWSHGWGNSACEMYWVRLIKAIFSRSKRKHNHHMDHNESQASTSNWTFKALRWYSRGAPPEGSMFRFDVSMFLRRFWRFYQASSGFVVWDTVIIRIEMNLFRL